MKIADERFWRKVVRSQSSTACWTWGGAIDRDGYGRLTRKVIGDEALRAHRYAFFLFHGRWPEGNCYHTCGKRHCVRPSHLHDAITRPHGEKSADEMYLCVERIRRRYVKGSRINGLVSLSREYNLPQSFIRSVIKGEL